MSTLEGFFDWVIRQQDFAWFLAFSAWGWVGIGGWQQRSQTGAGAMGRWAWSAAAGGVLGAAAELAMLASVPEPFFQARTGAELLLTAIFTLQVAALGWALLGDGGAKRHGMPARWGFAVIVILVVGVRIWFVRAGALAPTALALALAGYAWARQRREGGFAPGGKSARLARLGLLVASTVLSTVGPLAEWLGQPRRWSELPGLGLPAATLQVLLALAFADLLRNAGARKTDPQTAATQARELRWMGRVLGLWLVFGFVLATVAGHFARQSFERGILARARVAAALLDPGEVARCFGPKLRLNPGWDDHQKSGRLNRIISVPFLLGASKRVSEQLQRVQEANPDCRWPHVMTLRDGYLVSCLFATGLPGTRDRVSPHRVAGADDLSAWAERRLAVEGPAISPWGELVRARAPIVAEDGRMLGWLALDFGASQWFASQVQARLLTFVVLGLGVLIALLRLRQRLREAESEATQRRAEASAAADRAKTAFLAKVSHELRTPIQGILGYSELLRGAGLPEEQLRRVEAVHGQGELLIRLVNDLIDLSAIQAGAFRLVERPGALATHVREVVESLRPLALTKGLSLRIDIEEALPATLEFDATRVRQVVLNLVGNALKFTTRGGVTAHLRAERADASASAPWTCELTVTDTGPGIAPEDQAKVFEPFSRLEQTAREEGAGLGLALALALSTSMGGGIHIESDGRSGTAFTARWRLRPALATEPAVAAAQPSLEGWKILIADDNALVRELFTAYLTEQGAQCATACDGLEAIERCGLESFDALVLDLSMPWVDGYEVVRRLRASGGRGVRIVGVSAHAAAAEQEKALAAGMEAFLVKPVVLAELAAAVAGRAAVRTATRWPGDAALQAKLEKQFRTELPQLLAELAAARAAEDFGRISLRAHYLKNSADVLEHRALQAACIGLEAAATAGDTAACAAAWARLQGAAESALR